MEELQRDFKGIWIPKDVWLDERLNALDKIILMEIHSLDNGENGCYASNKYLAEFCQCTETKVSTTITKLKEFGYIELANFDGRHRTLKIKTLSLKNLKADIKNFKSNNINNKKENIINNINIINNKNDIDNSNNLEKLKRKKELTKKQINAIECKKILEDFIKDEDIDIQNALRDYIEVRKTKGLQPKQLQILLEDFEKAYSNKSKNVILNQIRNATAGGWLKLVYDNFNGSIKSSYSSKPNFDNTSNHNVPKGVASMTEKEKQDFYQNNLAKDKNGNYIKF